jgi:hypothetical protein
MEAMQNFLFVAIFFGLIFFIAYRIAKYRNKQLERFADMLDDGRFYSATKIVEGKIDGLPVRLSYRIERSDQHRSTYQRFTVTVPSPAGTFVITKANVFHKMGRFVGLVDDVKTGNKIVDDKYILEGQKKSLKNLFQYREAEKHFDSLFRSNFSPITLDPEGKLYGEIGDLTYDPNHLMSHFDQFVALAKLSGRKEIKTKGLGPGLRFAWTGGSQKARCPYCRDDLNMEQEELLDCENCNTVHHKACFEEANGCTVFGCDGTSGRVKERA